jgi:tagaturonate reductase
VRTLAERWALDRRFVAWLDDAVPFCDTLVDRIVPGAPTGDEAARLARALGYRDALVTTCEPYRLFAIHCDAAPAAQLGFKERLGFADADAGIVVTDDIAPYRERKVRLLNGAHTAMVPAALLAGCETVREAMEDAVVGPFARRMLLDEIVPTVDAPGAESFAHDVLDRFANPFIRHALVDITLQGTMKTRVRLVPTIRRYAERTGGAPPMLSLAFAAYLLLMRGEAARPDDQGERVRAAWRALAPADLVAGVLSDEELWGTDLTAVPGFAASVAAALLAMLRDGVRGTLDASLAAAEVK